MKPNCALSIILASSLLGLPARTPGQSLLAAALQSGNAQPAPPSISFPPGQIPTAVTWPQFLESVRRIALSYTRTLPDFICTQKIWRLAKFGRIGDWRLVDQIVTEVSYFEGMEHYRILKIDNKPISSKAEKGIAGFVSEGDFGNSLFQLFAPESNASFSMDGSDRINKRNTVRARYYVPQANSRFHIGLGTQKVTTAYGGRCWIELASHRVVRLEAEAEDIPRSFPVERSSHSTEYDWIEIGGAKYWLPVRASVYLQLSNKRSGQHIDFYKAIYGQLDPSGYGNYPVVYAKNDMEFKQYRKFGSEIRLITNPE